MGDGDDDCVNVFKIHTYDTYYASFLTSFVGRNKEDTIPLDEAGHVGSDEGEDSGTNKAALFATEVGVMMT